MLGLKYWLVTTKLTNEYTQRFYRLLKERGFKDEEINLDLRLEEELLDYLFYPF
jgi:hypothetical protein